MTTESNLAVAREMAAGMTRTRSGGGREQIPYLSWMDCTELMDVAYGIDGWDYGVEMEWPPGGSAFPPIVRARVTIGGLRSVEGLARVIPVTKRDGSLMQPVSDVEQLTDGTRWTTGADPYEVAERAAFVRACGMLGIRAARAGDQPRSTPAPSGQTVADKYPAAQQSPPTDLPQTVQMVGLEWRLTRDGTGYSAGVDPDTYAGAIRLLVKKSDRGDYGATAFDKAGPMSDVGWHNAATARGAVDELIAALTQDDEATDDMPVDADVDSLPF